MSVHHSGQSHRHVVSGVNVEEVKNLLLTCTLDGKQVKFLRKVDELTGLPLWNKLTHGYWSNVSDEVATMIEMQLLQFDKEILNKGLPSLITGKLKGV